MFSSLTNIQKQNPIVKDKNVNDLTSEPFWFQKRMFNKKINKFKTSTLKNQLNMEIIIKAQNLKIKKLEKFRNDNLPRVMDNKRIINEKLYMMNLKKFLRKVSQISIKYGVQINIFGGILGKIINPEFKLNDYDIDIFCSSGMAVTLDKFIYVISILEKEKIILNSNLIINNSNNSVSYSRIRNRPGKMYT